MLVDFETNQLFLKEIFCPLRISHFAFHVSLFAFFLTELSSSVNLVNLQTLSAWQDQFFPYQFSVPMNRACFSRMSVTLFSFCADECQPSQLGYFDCTF